MVRVLVTGAGGYIGRHAVGALADEGADVVALQRTDRPLDPRARAIVGDFRQLDAAGLAELGPLNVVLHMAWSDGFNHNAPSHLENLPYHARFAKLVAEAGIVQFVGMGTMHEVGYWEGAIDRSTPNAPRSMYGIAKNAAREASRLETTAKGGIFQWLRAYYILGDDTNSQSLFAKILAWDAEGKKTFPFTSGLNEYDFISVADLARQIALACLQTEVTGVIDCCSGKPVALRDQVEAFIAQYGLQIRPEYGAFPDRAYDSPRVWGDAGAIEQILAAASPSRRMLLST